VQFDSEWLRIASSYTLIASLSSHLHFFPSHNHFFKKCISLSSPFTHPPHGFERLCFLFENEKIKIASSEHQVYAMPAQFSVDASIKGAERVSFGYFSAGTAYTRDVTCKLKNSASVQQPTLKNKRIPYNPTTIPPVIHLFFFLSHQ
jgi:hypothetical protein